MDQSRGVLSSLQKTGRWAYRFAYHNTLRRSHPRVLCNSFHKAGTHLLVGAVNGLPSLDHYGRGAYWHSLSRSRASRQRHGSLGRTKEILARCLPGEVIRGHIGAHPEISRVLTDAGFKHVFVYRDLRDVFVSLFFWWSRRLPGMDSWPYRYFHSLDSDASRLAFLIQGWPDKISDPGFPTEIDFPDVGSRFREFLPWLSDPACLAVRFEDLSDVDARTQVHRKIVEHVLPEHLQPPPGDIESMVAGTAASHSKTFRRGVAGDWRNHLSEEHRHLFKSCAGDLLISLGYERDHGW